MTALETAKLYFDLSNKSDFPAIARLFTDKTTYSSQTTGKYLGVDEIVPMQKEFHAKFKSLSWHVNSIKEVRPGIILFDYNFSGVFIDGKEIKSSGLEYVTVRDGKIQDIEIENKT